MAKPDFYAELGLSDDASPDDVKTAYREAAKRTHPDLNKVTGDDEAFKRISAAYEVLKDPHARALYDRDRARAANPFAGVGDDPLADVAASWAWQRWQTAAESAERRARREEERRQVRCCLYTPHWSCVRSPPVFARPSLQAEAEAIAYWVAQKEFAEADRLRFRQEAASLRAETDARRAKLLSKVWATKAGVIWQDAVAVVAMGAALAYTIFRLAAARKRSDMPPP
jgi:curved DNA-binding protein CbpA